MLLTPERSARQLLGSLVYDEEAVAQRGSETCLWPSSCKGAEGVMDSQLRAPSGPLSLQITTYRTILPERAVCRPRFIYFFSIESHLKGTKVKQSVQHKYFPYVLSSKLGVRQQG